MAGSKPKHDYDSMRYAYITSNTSLRQLADQHEVPISSLTSFARRHGWDDQRDKFVVLQEEKSIEALADKRAKKVADIEMDTFDVIHAAVLKLGIDLDDRWVTDPATGERRFIPGQTMTPEGLTKLIDKYLVMTGNVTDRRANLGLNIDATEGSGLPKDVLRGLRDLAVSKGAGEGSMGQSPIPRIAGAKSVN